MEKHEHHNDNPDGIALNQALVDMLKEREHIQSSIEAAFRAVLRHKFLPGTPLEEVYSNRAISAKQDQNGKWISSSSQPTMMAIMLEQLGLQPGHRVLEIGAGTGYNAALMAHIVGETGQIVTVDIDVDLVEAAREHLAMAGFDRVQVLCADGGYGYPDGAPFDRIILTVGAPDITPAWWDQIGPGGRLVLPLILKGSMKSIAFERVDDHLASISVRECGFMPLRGDFAAKFSNQVQLGPNEGLYLESTDELMLESDEVYRLLTGKSEDVATGVEVTGWDVLVGKLWTWLSLQELQMCKLTAEGDMVERNIVPRLIGFDGIQKSSGSVIVLDKMGLVALTRPPGQPAPLLERDKLFTPDSPFVLPFALFVRQYGSDGSTAQRLVALIQAWDAAGQPLSDDMRIRVYRKGFEYRPTEGEYVIEKEWTTLVIEWATVN